VSSRGPLPLLIYPEGAELQAKYSIWYNNLQPCGACRPASCAARLHIVDRATSNGAAHINP